MTLFFLSGYLDVAATTLADLATLAAALVEPADPDNAAAIDNVCSKIPALTQGDTGYPLTFAFYDSASASATWVANAAITLNVGLGDPDTRGAFAFVGPTALTVNANTRIGNLDLSGQTLSSALSGNYGRPQRWSRGPVTRFTLQARKTTAGVTETVAALPVTLQAGVLS